MIFKAAVEAAIRIRRGNNSRRRPRPPQQPQPDDIELTDVNYDDDDVKITSAEAMDREEFIDYLNAHNILDRKKVTIDKIKRRFNIRDDETQNIKSM